MTINVNENLKVTRTQKRKAHQVARRIESTNQGRAYVVKTLCAVHSFFGGRVIAVETTK